MLIVPNYAYLITLDVDSLHVYPNISHDEAIVCFLRKFKRHPNKVFLLNLLNYVLKTMHSNLTT